MKIVIHGAGLSGCTAARILAEEGHTITVLESRDKVGGNCMTDINGIHMHGPHIFHTNDDEVWEFVNRFAEFREYTHIVQGNTSEGIINLPYVDTTLTEDTSVKNYKDSEYVYNLIYRDYSFKQWGFQPSKSVIDRVKIKCKKQDGYFTDKYQGLPVNGYTEMCNNMLDHVNITVKLNIDKNSRPGCDKRIWTGPIDEYFNFNIGRLKYRSLDFKYLYGNQKIGTLNECNLDVPYTRTTSYKAMGVTAEPILQREYPCNYDGTNEAYYPMGDKLYDEYAKLETDTIFIGRLAEYKYLDMDKSIRNSIDKIIILR